jgi:hypothetical protein
MNKKIQIIILLFFLLIIAFWVWLKIYKMHNTIINSKVFDKWDTIQKSKVIETKINKTQKLNNNFIENLWIK